MWLDYFAKKFPSTKMFLWTKSVVSKPFRRTFPHSPIYFAAVRKFSDFFLRWKPENRANFSRFDHWFHIAGGLIPPKSHQFAWISNGFNVEILLYYTIIFNVVRHSFRCFFLKQFEKRDFSFKFCTLFVIIYVVFVLMCGSNLPGFCTSSVNRLFFLPHTNIWLQFQSVLIFLFLKKTVCYSSYAWPIWPNLAIYDLYIFKLLQKSSFLHRCNEWKFL